MRKPLEACHLRLSCWPRRRLAVRRRATPRYRAAWTFQPAAAITGSGTTGFLPDFTGAATVGNSAMFQSGTSPTAKIGINTSAPTTALDIHGGAAVRGTLVLPATGAATAATGKASQPINVSGVGVQQRNQRRGRTNLSAESRAGQQQRCHARRIAESAFRSGRDHARRDRV